MDFKKVMYFVNKAHELDKIINNYTIDDMITYLETGDNDCRATRWSIINHLSSKYYNNIETSTQEDLRECRGSDTKEFVILLERVKSELLALGINYEEC